MNDSIILQELDSQADLSDQSRDLMITEGYSSQFIADDLFKGRVNRFEDHVDILEVTHIKVRSVELSQFDYVLVRKVGQ